MGLQSIKWVDKIVFGCPYSATLEQIRFHDITFAVHGDDIAYDSNGEDCVGLLKRIGKFKYISRTQSISTSC